MEIAEDRFEAPGVRYEKLEARDVLKTRGAKHRLAMIRPVPARNPNGRALRPFEDNILDDVVPALGPAERVAAAEDRDAPTRLQPRQHVFDHTILIHTMKGIADSDQIERRGGRDKILRPANAPGDVGCIPTLRLFPRLTDH